jgi:hypothetical protein
MHVIPRKDRDHCRSLVRMTRRGWWLSGRVATWMDGIKSGYSRRMLIPPVEMTRVELLLSLAVACWKARVPRTPLGTMCRVLPHPLSARIFRTA